MTEGKNRQRICGDSTRRQIHFKGSRVLERGAIFAARPTDSPDRILWLSGLRTRPQFAPDGWRAILTTAVQLGGAVMSRFFVRVWR